MIFMQKFVILMFLILGVIQVIKCILGLLAVIVKANMK